MTVSATPAPAPARSALRIGFVTPGFAAVDEGWWAFPGVGRLVDALAERCASLTVGISQVARREEWLHHRMNVSDDAVVPLPEMPTIARGIFRATESRLAIREIERRSDVLIVQLPFSAPTALLAPRRPRVYHACADLPGVVRASPFYRGARRLAAVSTAQAIHLLQRRLASRPGVRLLANGEALFERFGSPRGRAVISSTLRDAEIGSIHRSRPEGAPFRILFAGYLRPEKGIDVLVAAYERVLARVSDAELVIVGTQDLAEGGAADRLRLDLERVRARGSVRMAGHLEFGSELFQEYADADVFVLPSRSEGTPRVLVEARAFGCPVVATRVGGIPSSVAEGRDGLLVPPDDVTALADAILRVATEPGLRQSLSRSGRERVRSWTIDGLADALVEQAAAAVAEAR